jgi:hypothetical protein
VSVSVCVAPVAFADDDITMFVEPVATPVEVIEAVEDARFEEGLRQEREGIDWEAITNVGKQVWKVIQDNAPVANIQYDYATAMPRGITSAGDLDGFSDLTFQSWRLHGKNAFGATVYDVTYTLVHQYGGSYQGKGKYLATVSILPSNVEVLWGYTVNMKVATISTLNVGTAADPVGSASLEMSFNVKSLMKNATTTTLFQFRGDRAEVTSTRL